MREHERRGTSVMEGVCTGFGHKVIFVDNGGSWGSWSGVRQCPPGTYATGFSLKVEKKLGPNGDDTALNGIMLHCTGLTSATISSEMCWGDWTHAQYCPSGSRLMSFQLRVERHLGGNGDDTAANNVRFFCTDGTMLQGFGQDWGEWGNTSPECSAGICGLSAKLEEEQGSRGDDTSLNDVKMLCC
ncbi:vitelline membrane outer layer protein 1 homolog [Engraulis encrasicolus]|uniref:vitelline membrane outer layer protein 1 homolog n=1 Tax=Engraulis encrasicolus TaxID=184585 RepID=UPI002FD51F22